MKVDSRFDSEIKSLLYGEAFKNASHQTIITEVEAYTTDEVTQFWEKLRKLKKDLLSKNLLLNFNYFIFPAFENTQLTGIKFPKKAREAFNFWEKEEEVIFSQAITFYKADFIGVVNFQSTIFQEAVDFSKTITRGNINFSQTKFKRNVDFMGTQFKQECKFDHTSFEDIVSFEEVRFQGRTLFQETIFYQESSFRSSNSKYRISFYSCTAEKISFNYSRIENAYFIKNSFKYLNLHGVAIEKPFFSDNIINEAGRETYAYLKHFFDDKKDYISANHYYAKEMRSYQKELFPDDDSPLIKRLYKSLKEENLGDKLVFGFTKSASNFGQNIFLPLYWIFSAGFIFTGLSLEKPNLFMSLFMFIFFVLSLLTLSLKKYFKVKKYFNLPDTLKNLTFSLGLAGVLIYNLEYLNLFAKAINPIRFLRTEEVLCNEMSFSCLLLRLFVAVMIYHFISSVKRSIKR